MSRCTQAHAGIEEHQAHKISAEVDKVAVKCAYEERELKARQDLTRNRSAIEEWENKSSR